MRPLLLLALVCIMPCFNSCVDQEPERKPVPPTSAAGSMPWNRPMPGEGTAQFGGMLQRR